jgi:hypothetical protein
MNEVQMYNVRSDKASFGGPSLNVEQGCKFKRKSCTPANQLELSVVTSDRTPMTEDEVRAWGKLERR